MVLKKKKTTLESEIPFREIGGPESINDFDKRIMQFIAPFIQSSLGYNSVHLPSITISIGGLYNLRAS